MRKIPFPQANNLELIFNIFWYVDENGISKEDVISKSSLTTEREASYYLDALLYIGLLEKIKRKYFLNDEGWRIKRLPRNMVRCAFAIKLLENEFIDELYGQVSGIQDKAASLQYIADRISEQEALGQNTSLRRASTVLSWFNWINQV